MSTSMHAEDDISTVPLATLNKNMAPPGVRAVENLEQEDRKDDKGESASADTRDASPDAEVAPPVYRLYKRRSVYIVLRIAPSLTLT